MFIALLLAATITLQQGEVKVLKAEEVGVQAPIETAIFGGRPVPIFERNRSVYLVLAVDVAKSAGNYLLQVYSDRGFLNLPVRVKERNFRTVREKTPYKPLILSPKERAEKEAERQPMLLALKRGEPGQIWQGLFLYPVSISRVSGEFGLRRIYTNHVSRHRGVDIVPEPSRIVRAISEAHVLYAEDRELYLEGKTVILDHGQGIISIYLHLSKTLVKAGDNIAQGKEIGLIGSTGNSTGRHLHFAITVAGAHVDPLKFIGVFQNLK